VASRNLIVAVAVVLFLSAPAPAQTPAKIPILIDTDIGYAVDDAFALALALASPELDVRAITTVTGDAHTRALMVCRLLHAAGRGDVPVASTSPARAVPDFSGTLQYGLRPAFRNRPERIGAVELLYKQLKARPGELSIVALGPLTNVADLLAKHPDCKAWIKRIVVMAGAVRVGYENKPPVEAEWNIHSDVKAAQAVFASGIPLVVAPLDATATLKLEGPPLRRLFAARTPLTDQLHALYQLWDKTTPILFDSVAVALCFTERFCTMEELRIEVDDKGITKAVQGKPNARVATGIRRDEFLAWHVDHLAPQGARPLAPSKLPLTNVSKPVPWGKMPNLVHVIEDYETDIERRWWLAGKLETMDVPPESKRACRGVLTNDFDDRMGDPRAMYKAVVFNPVPGPPMGKNTRLSFRYKLQGTGNLRVQIYTLSKGYHRHLTLTGLPQRNWQSLTVDMTAARRPDGSGGPLSEDERIDDMQFYTDADAELLIDDIVLHDAALPGETRLFPKRLHFTGWFDTGKQGKEWPGDFEIVAKKPPQTWKAAKSVPHKETGKPWLRLSLRGERPLGASTQIRFRYHLTGADALSITLLDSKGEGGQPASLKGLTTGKWAEATVPVSALQRRDGVSEIRFTLSRTEGELLIDDLLLYEPPSVKRP